MFVIISWESLSTRGQFKISKSKRKTRLSSSCRPIADNAYLSRDEMMVFERSSLISSPFPNYGVVPAAGGDSALSVICKCARFHQPMPCAPPSSHRRLLLGFLRWNYRPSDKTCEDRLRFLALLLPLCIPFLASYHYLQWPFWILDGSLISRLIRCLNGTTCGRDANARVDDRERWASEERLPGV